MDTSRSNRCLPRESSQGSDVPDENPYVIGPSRARKHPNVETKPTPTLRDRSYRDLDPATRSTYDSGGGYERVRSTEVRPHTSAQGSEDVYAAIHRLNAVAWWDDPDATASDILPQLAGQDVHHDAPEVSESRGVEWDNRECCLSVIDHGRHTTKTNVTNAEIRAWGEDAKRQAASDGRGDDPEECRRCGATETLVRSPDFDGLRCPSHAAEESDGATMEVV